MIPPRILLVDDDAANRLTLGALLEDSGFTVLYAQSLHEARDHLGQADVELCVLDWNLGGESGLELVPLLRNRARPPRVALLSGSDEPCGHGVDLQLSKGDRSEEIVARLSALLNWGNRHG